MIPKNNRVGKHLFDEVFSLGRTEHGEFLYLKYIKTEKPISKVSVVVPKKIASRAVSRNSIRRKIQGCILPLLPVIKPYYACIFFLKKNILKTNQEDICNEVQELLKKAQIFSL
jgi:ribonuclease P protein component